VVDVTFRTIGNYRVKGIGTAVRRAWAAAFFFWSAFPAVAAAQDPKGAVPPVVAKFNGALITEPELQKAAARDFEQLEMQRLQFQANYDRARHQILETSLSRLLEDKLLEAEAAKRGISRDQLLGAELQGKVKEPAQEDVNAYYAANKDRLNQPLAAIGGQIQQFLKSQNYNSAKAEFIERLKHEYRVTVSLEPLRVNADAAGSPDLGEESAPVTIVEFSDFQCPYCAGLSGTLHRVVEKYSNQVRLVFRNYPLSQIHPNAEQAAEAALCAASQGRFWEMHNLMFAGQAQLNLEGIRAKAAQAQLKMDDFNSCLASGSQAGRVKQDLLAGASLGVSGTPALFINGRFLSGAQPFEEISRIIDEELGPRPKPAKSDSSAEGRSGE
jgi:protein-disulfide isomerase